MLLPRNITRGLADDYSDRARMSMSLVRDIDRVIDCPLLLLPCSGQTSRRKETA